MIADAKHTTLLRNYAKANNNLVDAVKKTMKADKISKALRITNANERKARARAE